MNYDSIIFSSKKIATEKRLEYIMYDRDPRDEGHINEAFELGSFGMWDSSEDPSLSLQLERENMLYINELLEKNAAFAAFTNVDEFELSYIEYDYYWILRTTEQFIAEEAFARAGLSRFQPVDLDRISSAWSRYLPEIKQKISEFIPDRFNREDGTYWTGDTVNGKYNGKGTLYYSSGEIYEGELLDGAFHGEGVLFQHSKGTHDSLFWAGEWKNSKPYNGKGRYQMKDDRYTDIVFPTMIAEIELREGKPWDGFVCYMSFIKDDNEKVYLNRSISRWKNGEPVKEESDPFVTERFRVSLT